MKRTVAFAIFFAMTTLTTVGAGCAQSSHALPRGGGPVGGPGEEAPSKHRPAQQRLEIGEHQYRILLGQCRYADGREAQERCRAEVRERYRIGSPNPSLDCRTYSGVTVCGQLPLSARERACVRESVDGGLTPRRAEVECYAFR